MIQSLNTLKRRAREYGMSIRKNRGAGYSLVIDSTNATWCGFDGDPENLDIETIQYWLDEFDSQNPA